MVIFRWMLGTGFAVTALLGCSEDGGSTPLGNNNAAPVITSSDTASAAENTTSTVYTAAANDADGDTVTFSISGGADEALFMISGAVVSFVSPPDFENPGDANTDNIYQLTISASDGAASTSLAISITVTDAADGFRVRRIATGLSQPLFLIGRGDGTNRVFVVEKGGQIETLDLDTGLLAPTPFLDISSSISPAGEGGLLGLALAPDFSTSGVFYVYVTNLSGDTEIRRYQVSAADPDLADVSSADVILTFAQLQDNHNGGWIGFDSGGLLYIASGDGGGSGDPGNNGQDTNTLLGAILRIDPSGDDFPSDVLRDYVIPAGNPFATSGGAAEIYAYGLRNPFRASFDRATDDLYIGDVGQDAIEEIDLIRPGEAGLNFGWNILEGTQTFAGGSSANLAPPIAEYGHGSGPLEGGSVAGGYVYRGPIASLVGQYIFGDFVSGNIWSFDTASAVQGSTIASSAFTIQTSAFTPDLGVLDNLSSFGEDDAGNLYLLGIDGEVFAVEPE